MTDDQINIAIAEACGWRFVPEHDRITPQGHEVAAYPQRWIGPDHMEYFEDVPYPNYCHDLNAMHEAEKTLDLIGLTDFGCEIVRLVEHKESQHCPHWGRIAHATARQRSEAFLRVKGLWKEEV